MILVYLSGLTELAKAEVEELAKAYDDKIINMNDRFAIVEDGKFVGRLAYSKVAGEIICKTSLDLDLPRCFNEDHTGFGVNVWGLKGKESARLKKRFGDKVKGKPNLSNPSEVFDLVVNESDVIVTKRVWAYNPKVFSSRDLKARPVFNPTSLKPKLARLLVNLSGVKPEQTLLDPFCGVGGILIEASILGVKATGVEIDARWARGARQNLAYLGLNARVVNEDFFEVGSDLGKFDTVVTDLPYGRSTRLDGDMTNFYRRAFNKMKELSKRLVVMGPMDLVEELKSSEWNVRRKIKMRVHRSLERWIHVCNG